MRELIDFFNHGILPFVGRTAELQRVERFWRDTAAAPGLRAMLLVGEAGAGKSRLVDVLTPAMSSAGGVLIHTKLYPGSTNALAPLVAGAIGSAPAAIALLRRAPGPALADVLGALQRLARLRPVLLVLEDLHLLDGDARAELVALLEGLDHETLSVLGLARPGELAVRGILERYIVDEVRLEGLTPEELGTLWKRLFGDGIDDELLLVLHRVTAGAPLALRSALRGALRSEAIARDGAGAWRVTLPSAEFAAVLERQVAMLAEGMIAHCSPEERAQARQLATLGELFSREAARALLPEADRAIDVLTFKGVLAMQAGVDRAPLVAAAPSAYPLLAFSHTLLHRFLADSADPDPVRLIELLASDAPLFAVLPHERAVDLCNRAAVPVPIVERAVARAIRTVEALERTADWRLGSVVLQAAEAMAAGSISTSAPADERRVQRAHLLSTRLLLLRRESYTPEYGDLIDQLLALTDDPSDFDMAEQRLRAWRFELTRRRREIDVCLRIWEEIDRLLERFPELRRSDAFVDVIESSAQTTSNDDDRLLTDRVEIEWRRIVESPETPESFKSTVLRRLGGYFLWRFDTPEELAARRRLLAELEPLVDRDDSAFHVRKAAFHQGVGEVDQALAIFDEQLPRLRDRGLVRQYFSAALFRIYALSWRVQPLDELANLAERLLADAPDVMIPWMRERIGVRLARVGLLFGDAAWSRRLVERTIGDDPNDFNAIGGLSLLMLAGLEGRLGEYLADVRHPVRGDEWLHDLARGIAPSEDVEARISALTKQPLLTRDDIAYGYVVLFLLAEARRHPATSAVVGRSEVDIRRLVGAMLEWLEERGQDVSMRPVLALFGEHLGQRERARWSGRIEALSRSRAEARPTGVDRLRVRMLGSIEIEPPGEPPVRVRGARVRTLLGLMTADRLLPRPLSLREFQRIAAGDEPDQEKARKTTSMGLLRLREALGADLLDVDAETPRLDLDRVEVDLLSASERIDAARRAAASRVWVQAAPALLEALQILGDAVAFPGLYETFFEAARDDFESALRETIVSVAGGLIGDGDDESAERILRLAIGRIPEDEELAAMLADALVRLGQRTEAERLRMRAVVED